MSKAKRRYARRKSRAPRTEHVVKEDAHHICFQKRHYTQGALLELRRFHYCIIYIPKDTLHRYIHERVKDVPAPSQISAKEALKQLRMLEKLGAIRDSDPIEKRLMLLASLFDCSDQPTADALRRQLKAVHDFYKKAPR